MWVDLCRFYSSFFWIDKLKCDLLSITLKILSPCTDWKQIGERVWYSQIKFCRHYSCFSCFIYVMSISKALYISFLITECHHPRLRNALLIFRIVTLYRPSSLAFIWKYALVYFVPNAADCYLMMSLSITLAFVMQVISSTPILVLMLFVPVDHSLFCGYWWVMFFDIL